MPLIGGQNGEGSVGGGAQLEGALQTVVLQHGSAEDGGKQAGGMAAQQVHLPQAVPGGDVALGEDKVVHGGGADVRDAARVAGDCDRSGKTVDGERTVELRQVLAHGVADEVAPGEERGRGERGGERQKQAEDAQPVAGAATGGRIEGGYEGGFESGVWCGRVFRLSVCRGQLFGLGVCSSPAFHPAHVTRVAQVGFAGTGRWLGVAGVRVVAAHGLG
ncbi:MAG: hypothetical protein ABSF57_07100 [Acidobacteriaceae bacterium]